MPSVGFFDDPLFDQHSTVNHPEHAGRLHAIRRAIAASTVRSHLVPLSFAPASEEDVLLIHAPAHLAFLRRIAQAGGGWIDADTVVSPPSVDVALAAVGAGIRAVTAVLSGEQPAVFAAVRPPGHHATPTRAMGFCLFNTIAIAAEVARQRFGLERILIVDFDVHHGNGTQDCFYRESGVCYQSVHQWPLFPGTGRVDEIGEGPGAGFTVNLPLPPGCGDASYQRAFEDVFLPHARRFQPELVLVSAGYDAYWRDPLANHRLTVNGFARIVRLLVDFVDEHCPGRLVLLLEGGYDLAGLGASVVATLGELAGTPEAEEPVPPPPPIPEPDIQGLLATARRLHRL
ncbi:MAG: histone deacetylase [Chloroflexi bacterium]|nr:histone deacetylase [Chloroflexota bacterium]